MWAIVLSLAKPSRTRQARARRQSRAAGGEYMRGWRRWSRTFIPLLARTTSRACRYPCSNCVARPAQPAPAPKDILRSPTNPEVGVGGGTCTLVLLDCAAGPAQLPLSVIADSPPRSFWLDTFTAQSEILRSMFLSLLSTLGPFEVCAATDCWP